MWRGERRAISGADRGSWRWSEALTAAGRLELDDDGLLVGVHGLTARATATSNRTRRRRRAHVVCPRRDRDPRRRRPRRDRRHHLPALRPRAARHDPGRHARARPDVCLWLPGGPCSHLVEDFCRHANLYCSRDHLTAVVPPDRPGRAVDVAEAAAIGRITGATSPRPGSSWRNSHDERTSSRAELHVVLVLRRDPRRRRTHPPRMSSRSRPVRHLCRLARPTTRAARGQRAATGHPDPRHERRQPGPLATTAPSGSRPRSGRAAATGSCTATASSSTSARSKRSTRPRTPSASTCSSATPISCTPNGRRRPSAANCTPRPTPTTDCERATTSTPTATSSASAHPVRLPGSAGEASVLLAGDDPLAESATSRGPSRGPRRARTTAARPPRTRHRPDR